MPLLARLRLGPLPIDAFAEVAASKASLKVRIHVLREAGVNIESIAIPNGKTKPRVAYRLVDGCCPRCGQAVAS